LVERRILGKVNQVLSMAYRLLTPIFAATMLLSAYACGSEEEGGGDAGDEVASQTVEVTIEDFAFKPGSLLVEDGQPLELTLKNTGQAPHTFTIDELNVDIELQPGAEDTVLVETSDSGDFEYYCRFHKAQNMKGALTVGSPSANETPAVTPSDPPSEYDGY
jgi:plastocyanin